MKRRRNSGFDAPPSFVQIPKDWKVRRTKEGLISLIPPKGAEIPKELKGYVEEKA